MYVTRYDIDNENDVIGESDRFDWQGEIIVSRKSRSRFKRQSEINKLESDTFRKDESQSGYIVVVSNITVLDDYLVGTARSPFRSPRSSFIILVRYETKDWKEQVHRVLRKLWLVYGIVNAVLMTPCLGTTEDLVATYYPYYINESIIDPTADDYGAIEWTAISNMDYLLKLLQKLCVMNGFPFRVSIFNRFPTAITPPDVTDIVRRSYFNRAMQFSGGFGGFDGMVLGNIAEKMQFRTIVVKPTISDFGWVESPGNGSSFGTYFATTNIF